MNILELTRKLIEIKSCTGEEAGMMEYLSNHLEALGLTVEKQAVEGDRYNIYASAGEPAVVLSTHTDTVRPYFPFSEDNDYIYGRGACDTKGIVAAQLKCAEKLIDNGISNFGLLYVVGEEGESDGAKAANKIPNSCRWLINGEPTENKIAVGSKGTLRVKLSVSGKACHSAYPEMGESAIEKMIDILSDVRRIKWPSHELLGNTTCNIGVISGGLQPNVVAPHAEALLMVRVVTGSTEIKEILTDVVGNRGDLDFYFGYEPVLTHVPRQTGKKIETVTAAYGTDIPFLTNWGTPLLLGPGSILDAHTATEKISKNQLHDAVDLYFEIVKECFEA
jgi:acetylornithine deacetylase